MIKNKKFAYSEMLDALKGSFMRGELLVGDCLPTEKKLAEQFGISISSVRQGIQIMTDEGLVEKRRGSGMFVKRVPEHSIQICAVPKDSIGIFYETELNRYHPYFSEVRYGIKDVLVKYGWNLMDPYRLEESENPVFALDRQNNLTAIASGEVEHAVSYVSANRNIAGAIAMFKHAEVLHRFFGKSLPIVVPNPAPIAVSSVCYDLDNEYLDLMRLAVRKGAHHLVTLLDESEFKKYHSLLNIVEQLEGLSPGSLTFRLITRNVAKKTVYRSWANSAYRAVSDAKALLERSDAFLLKVDFELQGTLDALEEIGISNDQMLVAGIINKKSQISSTIRYDAIELDGYAVGETSAQLLQDRITGKVKGEKSIVLKGKMIYEK